MLALVIRITLVTLIGLFIGLNNVGNQVKAQTNYINELDNNWIKPVDGNITDTFGTRNGKHKGIDIAAPEGEKIVSVSDGKVTKSYYSDTYGHVVFVEHPEGYETVYAHLSKRIVNIDDHVKKGQTLGIIGNTGVSTGTHLHFELHEGEWTYEKEHALDPMFVFDSPNTTITAKQGHNEKGQQLTENKRDLIKGKQDASRTKMQSISVQKPVSDSHKVKELQKKVISVTKGDTLWSLSQNFKVSVKSLKKWNKLDSDVIYQGQDLIIYLNKAKSYVVQAGDTIHSIAKEYSLEPETIIEANQLETEEIYPQQVLLIK